MDRKNFSTEQKWRQQAEALKAEAEKLPPGSKRDDLLRKVRQLQTASHVNAWLSSPGLQTPT